MKKIFKIFLVCMMILTVTACSGGSESSDTATKIKWNKENKFADLISFKIEAIDQTKMITPDVIGTLYTYFEPADSKNVLLDLTMWVINVTDSNLKLNDEIEAIFTIDNTEYVASLLASKDNGGSLTSDVSLEANTANKVHYYVEVDPEKLDQKIEFSLNTKVEEDSDENKKSATLDFELKDAKKIIDSGADIIAFDGTMRQRPNNENLKDIIDFIHLENKTAMADISTFEEAKNAFLAGADIISTTLSGYTKETSSMPDTPDFNLLEKCTKELKCPVISEGKIWNKEDIKKAFDLGAHSVVIGSAVTRPHKIIEKFKEGLINGN